MLKIIGGTHRGRRIKLPPHMECRPTLGAVREALFNILSPSISGSRFLDLYAGSGAIGFEALSRGASSVVMVERDLVACRMIRENLRLLELDDRGSCLQSDVLKLLKRPVGPIKQADIIFADPPYAQYSEAHSTAEQTLAALDAAPLDSLLSPDGEVWIEERSCISLPVDRLQRLCFEGSRKYGSSTLWRFTRGK